MITHYIKIALRNLSWQKVLSFINISGLSIGLGIANPVKSLRTE